MNLRIVGEYDILENSEYDETAELSPRADYAARPTLQPDPHVSTSGLILVGLVSALALLGICDVIYRIIQWFRG